MILTDQHPLVSVITPSLNQGEFIEDTLNSVRRQDYDNLEHIVIDGGSTDTTGEFLEKYQEKYSLQWISEADEGHADAVNKGFRMAEGEIIGWLNSDDIYPDPRVISDVVDFFRDHAEVNIIYGDIFFIDKQSNLLMIRCVPRRFSFHRLLRGCFISQPAVFFRKRVIQDQKLDPDLQVAVDYEYWLRLACKYKFMHMNRILAADRYYSRRRMLTEENILQAEDQKIKAMYGYHSSIQKKVASFLDRTVTGSIRRIIGLWKLMEWIIAGDPGFISLKYPIPVIFNQINPFNNYKKFAEDK